MIMISVINEHRGNLIGGKYNFSYNKEFNKDLTSDLYSIKFVKNGLETYSKSGKVIDLNPNEILFCKPNEEISVNISSNSNTKGICLYLPSAFIEKNFDSKILDNLYPKFKLSVIDTELNSFYNSLSDGNNADKVLTLFSDYLQLFFKSKIKKLSLINSNKEDTKLLLWKNIESSKIYILNNFQNQIKLQDIADSAMMSKYHFQRVFKSFYQITPNQYLQNARLKHGLNLLNQEENDILDITFQCGFNDVKYFKKCVKRYRQSIIIR